MRQQPIPINKEYQLDENHFIVSKTDINGTITYVNQYFIEISGYTEEELIGQPHNMIRHPDMPKVVFKILWDHLKAEDEFWGYIKNMTKDGGYYWVLAHVTPSRHFETQQIIGYHSDRRAPEREKVEKIIPLYQELLQIERTQSLQAAEANLNQKLKEKEMSYEDFIFSL
ncbi:PAS domain-containing protein [Galenea microaerophila]